VGKNCVIGYSTEVARSVVGNDVWTHSSYVGDSVLGSNVSLGGGTVTGNLRLDEEEITSVVREKPIATGLNKFGTIIGDNSRTGIHTAIAPGMKIGSHCFVNSATLVTQDIPDGSFVKAKGAGELVIKPNIKRASAPEDRGTFRAKL
jgi:bifunctional UDP-N-acetylglucosamine pyrophosphorylase/glucosamine-1-phosphate N-acetyltransferase